MHISKYPYIQKSMYMCMYVHMYIYVYIHVIMSRQGRNHSWIGSAMRLTRGRTDGCNNNTTTPSTHPHLTRQMEHWCTKDHVHAGGLPWWFHSANKHTALHKITHGVFLDLGSDFRENLLFFLENPDSFVFHFATWLSFLARTKFVYGSLSPFLCVRKRTELATNFLQESDKLVSGSLVLLAPEWTVVKIALFRWSHRRVPRHTSTKAPYPCRQIHPGRSSQKSLSSGSRQGRWAHNLWEDGVSPWGNTPRCGKAQRLFPSALLTLEMKCWAEYR